ncbi:MAG: hypothetical protein H6Q00_1467 [Holophagaceae bacterium]|nr:hypothetical protein [Holophagaceae bacterium]
MEGEAVQGTLESTRSRLHEHCIVCWDRHPFGLKVAYHAVNQHTVEGSFPCGKSYEGYGGVIHGGIVSSLLDGAMANCILAKGLEAYTVDLRLRFRGAVRAGVDALIRGEWLRNEGPLHLLQASLSQEGKILVTARAKFFVGNPTGTPRPLPMGEAARELIRESRKRLR